MRTVITAVVAVLLLGGCRRDERSVTAKSHVPKSPAEVAGRWTSETEYENSYFNFTVAMPAGWEIKKGTFSELNKQAVDFLAGGEKNLKSMMESAVNKTQTIFWAYRYPMGTPGKSNPNVSMLIEDVSRLPGIVSPDDYLAAVRKTIELSGKTFNFSAEVKPTEFGGVQFQTLEAEVPMGVMLVRQKYYAKKEGAFVLLMASTTMQEGDEAEVAKVTSTIRKLADEKKRG